MLGTAPKHRLLIGGLLLLACGRGGHELPDLGSVELRARVERLKKEIQVEPTTAANVIARNEVLWPWANALGAAGFEIPVDLPLHCALVRWAAADGGEPELPPGLDLPLAVHVARVDGYLRELALEEDHPGALGRLAFDRSELLGSGDMATIEETYTVGGAPVVEGGGFLVAKAWVADELRLQHADPSAPNFVTARSSRDGVALEPVTIPWTGVHGSTRGNEDLPGFRVTGGKLEPGDVVTFTLGDRSGGSLGLRVPTFSTDRFIVPVYVDLDGSGNFLTSRWPELAIVGRPEVVAVRLLGPSVVTPGEPFALTVRSEDRAMNRASGGVPAYEVLLDGAVVARLPAAGVALARVEGLTVPAGTAAGAAVATGAAPVVARFEIRSEDGRLHGWSNPIWVEDDPQRRIYWGDTHAHTSLAEGQGSARGFFEYAVDDARLDFVTLSEHDIWMHDGEWRALQELTREFTAPGRFTAILGYEWSGFRNRGGHHNVFFRRAEGPRVSVHDADRLPALYQGLRQRSNTEDVLIIPHAHEAGDWTSNDAELGRLVELYSVHGSFEWFANRYLRNRFEVGLVAASDDHHGKPGLAPGPLAGGSQPGGLAAVHARENSADAIFDALRARATYATSGQRILLAATVNGHAMGTRQPATTERQIWARASGTAPIERIDVVRNGEVLMSRAYAAAPLTARAFVQVAFESSSDPGGDRVLNPRGYRQWVGSIEVEGARLVGLRPIGLDHASREQAAIDADVPQRVRFQILTRGRPDSILLELEGAGPSSALRIHLDAARGTSSVSSLLPGDELPPVDLRLELEGLRHGRVEHEIATVSIETTARDGDRDRVWIQAIDPDAPLDQELTYTDLTGGDGDYYYVRVTQIDGGRAWSSPFWVGEAKRQ